MPKFIRYCLFVVSFLPFTYGILFSQFNIALIGVLFMFSCNLIYSFERIKTRLIFMLFNLMMFVFLLSRPTISMFRREEWWYFSHDTIVFALISLFLSLLFMQIGAIIAEQYFETHRRKKISSGNSVNYNFFTSSNFLFALQNIALIMFYTTIMFTFICEFEKLIYMQGKNYEEFYVSFVSKLPYAFSAIGAMAKYALCVFLATIPSKRLAFPALSLYVMSAVPSLLFGMRNPVVLNLLFVLVYYAIRDIIVSREKWFGKTERVATVISFPAALIFLSAYNYIRAGESVEAVASKNTVWSSIVDLFYKQGVSFDVLGIGYDSIPNLPNVVPKNYTFGFIIDYFTHNSFAQKFFGAIDLGSGNSIIMATYSNSFAHSMSYVARDDYLAGHGWGTSFILEVFTDFGYVGIAIYCIVLSIVFIGIMYWAKKQWFVFTIVLIMLLNIFFTPRAEAISWILFIVTKQFWVSLLLCVAVAITFTKQYSFNSLTLNPIKNQ